MSKVIRVKAGDSWEKLAGMYLGDQRAFGDLLRANGGGWNLHPGDTIVIPGERHRNPFVSNNDVAMSNATNGANYQGPRMQQSADYISNYNKATAAGYKGVRGSPYETGATTFDPNAPPGSPGAAPYQNNAPIVKPNYATTPGGQEAATAWQQQHPSPSTTTPSVPAGSTGPTPATGEGNATQWSSTHPQNAWAAAITAGQRAQAGVGNFLDQTLAAIDKGVSDFAHNPVQTAQEAGAAFLNWRNNQKPGPLGPWTGVLNTPPPRANAASAMHTDLTPMSPQQAVVKVVGDQATAQQVAQAVMTNKNVPVTVPKDVAAVLVAQAATDPKLASQLASMYDVGPGGELVPRGTQFMPGAQNDPNFVSSGIQPPGGYSNAVPYGYNSSYNLYPQWHGRGARPARLAGYATRDFTVRIGQ